MLFLYYMQQIILRSIPFVCVSVFRQLEVWGCMGAQIDIGGGTAAALPCRRSCESMIHVPFVHRI